MMIMQEGFRLNMTPFYTCLSTNDFMGGTRNIENGLCACAYNLEEKRATCPLVATNCEAGLAHFV